MARDTAWGAEFRRRMAEYDSSDAVKKAISDTGAQLKKLRQERELAMRQREDLQSLPLAKSDCRQLLEDWIDRRASGFVERLQVGTAFYRRNPMAALPEDAKAAVRPMSILTACRDPQDAVTPVGLEANLFALLGPSIKQGLSVVLDTMDFSEAGPLRTERLIMIQALDARIDELDRREKELLEAAEQAGVRL